MSDNKQMSIRQGGYLKINSAQAKHKRKESIKDEAENNCPCLIAMRRLSDRRKFYIIFGANVSVVLKKGFDGSNSATTHGEPNSQMKWCHTILRNTK